ncbi:CBR-SET-14 protein [Apiospora phragmitis]|uniref:CBR-SET-14 protein n=1 Tax=Apiospora phragmitis TaxID=2905665 RepID=A0ABR1URQ4_9PEZI
MARSRASAFKAQQYWVYEAHKREEACDLARQLNLVLPSGSPGGNECDIMYPLHRLVITGKDTTPNLRLLFGPASDGLTEPHARARQTLLLNARSGLVDDEAPYIRPRKASRDEQDELNRQLQFSREYRGLLPHCFGGSRDVVLEKKRRVVEGAEVVGGSRHSSSRTNSKRLRGHDTGSGYPSPEWMDTSE